MRGGYSLGAVSVGEGGDDDDEEAIDTDADDALLEATWAFDMRSRIAWMDWTTLS